MQRSVLSFFLRRAQGKGLLPLPPWPPPLDIATTGPAMGPLLSTLPVQRTLKEAAGVSEGKNKDEAAGGSAEEGFGKAWQRPGSARSLCRRSRHLWLIELASVLEHNGAHV